MYIKLNSSSKNVLFHEYIHHLQNVTTYYSINAFLDLKSLYYDKIIKLKKNNDDSLLLGKEYSRSIRFLNESLGERNDVGFNTVEIQSIKYNILDYQVANLELKLLIDNKLPLVEYKLGTIAIMEGMANIIERKYFPNESSNKFLTYHICHILICYLCPCLINNEIAIIAILEISLTSSSPIGIILGLINKIKLNENINITPKEIFTIACNLTWATIDEDKRISKIKPMDNYDEICNRIDRTLDITYILFSQINENLFEPFKNWQKNILKDAYKIRKENPLLLTSMLESNVYTDIDNLIESYKIKLPTIILGDYEAILSSDEVINGKLILFLAEEEVFRYLNQDKCSNNKYCKIKYICEKYIKHLGKGLTKDPNLNFIKSSNIENINKIKNIKSVYDEELCKNPTNRPINEYLCPFTMIWRAIKIYTDSE
jgi:hypothetical protein